MATDAPFMRSENPLEEGRPPMGEQMPAPPPGPSISPDDMAVLKTAFTPQVLSVLARLGGGQGSGGIEPGATGPAPATGAMPETPVAQPTLPRPTSRLASMG